MTRSAPVQYGLETFPQFRAHPTRGRAPRWRVPTCSRRPGFDGRGGALRQAGRCFRQQLHQLRNAALQLGIAALQYFDRVLFDDDIRIHSVSLDDPIPTFIGCAELWHKYGTAVEQWPVIGNADRTAPGAFADQCADFPLTERMRKDIPVRG